MGKSINLKTDSKQFTFVYQNGKVVYISNDFFKLFDCFGSLESFLANHQDVEELFSYTHKTRKFYTKINNSTLPWYKNFLQKNFTNNRVVFYYKDKEYYFHFFITQSFAQSDEFSITFHSLEKTIAKEKRLVKTYHKQQQRIKKLEQLSKHKDKLSLMGEMMENITHQWKQPLTNILFTSTTIQLQKSLDILSDEELDNSIENIIEAVNYMSQTVNDFKNFLNEEKQRRVFELSEILYKVESIVKGNIKRHGIDLMIISDKQYYVFGFENELIQSIINIINNATDALKSKDPIDRKIEIILQKDANYNVIKIEDNGGGIPLEIIDKIFEHYFTTKGENGSGIGLHMTKEIIENNFKGKLKVYNSAYGAIFEIHLPLYVFEEIEEYTLKEGK